MGCVLDSIGWQCKHIVMPAAAPARRASLTAGAVAWPSSGCQPVDAGCDIAQGLSGSCCSLDGHLLVVSQLESSETRYFQLSAQHLDATYC